ncbi:kinase-like protein [Linderina pennispora]|uniref:1-phosphatidylinositol 4-kinase n=1 Tax=Linderina pennispora TaxID=61395 RepID=A0A1Y1W2V7_9FUNG|nr:kinase-like protein [Linderina pennispora]ORX67818.1 kinase-like protein [Linderina pennispora]
MCIPLWCPDSDGAHHHRIVRIPTEDTVVLNSAERAPYLLTLEILEPDASTDCSRSTKQSQSADAKSGSELAGAAHKESPGPPSAAVLDLDDELEVDITSLSIGRKFSEDPQVPPIAVEAAKDVVKANKEDEIPRSIAQPDVDEDLMAQVFGDLNDFSSNSGSTSPFSRQYSRSRSSGKGQRARGKSTDRDVSNSPRHRQVSATGPGNARHTPSQQKQQQQRRTIVVSNSQTPTARSSPTAVWIPVCTAVSSRKRSAPACAWHPCFLHSSHGSRRRSESKVTNLVVPQSAGGAGSADPAKGSDSTDTMRRRSKLSNPTSQALAMEEIREKLIHEMMQLEELRLATAPEIASDPNFADHTVSAAGDSDIDIHAVEYKDDPSAKVLKEDWESKKARIRRASPFGRHRNWNLLSVIVKDGADLRQEQLALQLIREMQRIWQREKTNVFVQYYRIMVTGEGCGLMETITNTVSVHSIKKEFYSRNPDYAGLPYTLYNYFVTSFGTPDTDRFKTAQDNFMRSLVAYSLITYILQIRDRHNGNILLDTAGHIIHIDFGFMLSNSPGSVGFEMAPFKFPMEYVDILGGRESAKFQEFRGLLVKAFLALRKYADNICLLVEMMVKDSPLPCLSGGQATVASLRDRLHLTLSDQQTEELVNGLLMSSCDNVTMRMYDSFQYYSNGIL